MYLNKKVIDVHGHLSMPPQFRANAMNLIALRTPGDGVVQIPEAAMRDAVAGHLKAMDERRVDVQLISPRPIAMMHWERSFLVEAWSRMTNDTIAMQCAMHPDRLAGVAQLPQSPEMNIGGCVRELDRCIRELGFVGAILNPDPCGRRQAPGLDDPAWYPLYEKAEELGATLVVHPSISRDPRLDRIPHSYQYNNMTEETLATLLLEHGGVFDRYPRLKVMVCHCGGCPRRGLEVGDRFDWCAATPQTQGPVASSGRTGGGQAGTTFAGKAGGHERASLDDNLWFDTCAYDPFYLAAALHQRGPHRMVFGTEAPGSGSFALNPQTGRPSDDILATLESFDFIDDARRLAMVHDNPLKAFPLLRERAALGLGEAP